MASSKKKVKKVSVMIWIDKLIPKTSTAIKNPIRVAKIDGKLTVKASRRLIIGIKLLIIICKIIKPKTLLKKYKKGIIMNGSPGGRKESNKKFASVQ